MQTAAAAACPRYSYRTAGRQYASDGANYRLLVLVYCPGTSVKIEPRILHMYGELFEYCCALYRLLGAAAAAAAAACSLYSYSGGASLASDHQAFTPRGDASA